jgi:hypothetical protein
MISDALTPQPGLQSDDFKPLGRIAEPLLILRPAGSVRQGAFVCLLKKTSNAGAGSEHR